eukprot:comp22369_c0_seq1/m.54158 comp22369_c0_seq1/g.54158  ORF comp22369_c0_seq1/g.54158 comp22369_c0_seq1/m.54158 type:complete len:300 (-) comp22369_c0_seq1:2137-3036(-)
MRWEGLCHGLEFNKGALPELFNHRIHSRCADHLGDHGTSTFNQCLDMLDRLAKDRKVRPQSRAHFAHKARAIRHRGREPHHSGLRLQQRVLGHDFSLQRHDTPGGAHTSQSGVFLVKGRAKHGNNGVSGKLVDRAAMVHHKLGHMAHDVVDQLEQRRRIEQLNKRLAAQHLDLRHGNILLCWRHGPKLAVHKHLLHHPRINGARKQLLDLPRVEIIKQILVQLARDRHKQPLVHIGHVLDVVRSAFFNLQILELERQNALAALHILRARNSKQRRRRRTAAAAHIGGKTMSVERPKSRR